MSTFSCIHWLTVWHVHPSQWFSATSCWTSAEMITTQDMSRKKFKFWLNNTPISSFLLFPFWVVELMLYRGCLRCNRVINLVALFPINYPQCYKKKLITHQRGPTPESLLTTLTNIELPQFAQQLIYLFPTQSEDGRKLDLIEFCHTSAPLLMKNPS